MSASRRYFGVPKNLFWCVLLHLKLFGGQPIALDETLTERLNKYYNTWGDILLLNLVLFAEAVHISIDNFHLVYRAGLFVPKMLFSIVNCSYWSFVLFCYFHWYQFWYKSMDITKYTIIWVLFEWLEIVHI